jgi:hypothetical protein
MGYISEQYALYAKRVSIRQTLRFFDGQGGHSIGFVDPDIFVKLVGQ